MEDKEILIWAEASASAVWTSKGASEPCCFPISETLQAQLVRWNQWFEMAYSYDDSPHQFDLDEFSAVGLDLAERVKAEMPDWTVSYKDLSLRDRAYEIQRRFGVVLPRSTWEFEVTYSSPQVIQVERNHPA